MTHTGLRVPEKSPEIATHDRAIGFAAAITLCIAVLAAVAFGLRRLRRRAESDRAERELRESIDDLEREGDV